MLVTEFVDGIKISDSGALKRSGFSLTDIDAKMFGAFGEQIFQSGFVHADPHPGNSTHAPPPNLPQELES